MRVITRLAMAALVIGLGACGDDSSGPDDGGSVAGTYTLRTVNGGNVPYSIVQLGTYKLEIVSSTLTVNSSGTFSETGTVRETEGGSVTTETATTTGSWTQTGNQVTFTDTDATTPNLVATFSGGNTLTYSGTEGGITFTFVYRK